MNPDKTVYGVHFGELRRTDLHGDLRPLTGDQNRNAAKKLNEHARLVEALEEMFDEFKYDTRYPTYEKRYDAIAILDKTKALLAEVEKAK